jgi:hypothetical protein
MIQVFIHCQVQSKHLTDDVLIGLIAVLKPFTECFPLVVYLIEM